jgi:Domain of unknown function DUF29
MTAKLQIIPQSLYSTDFVQWVETNLAYLKAQDYDRVDWESLLEEIADMSRRERQSLESNLIILLLHLLKWQYQPEFRSGSWKGSIREHRRRLNKALKASPSLRPYFQEILGECHIDAAKQAADETSLPLATFPIDCPYSAADILDEEFLPE